MQFWRSRSDEAVDDFDDFDPTPYSGGYDQALTYGRPLPPSDEMCYSISTAGDIDYERPQYSSGSQTSAYEAEAADVADRYGRPRPKPQIDSTSAYGGYGGRPQRQEYGSDYGLGFGGERPKRDEGYGGRAEQESGYGYQEETNRYGEDGHGGSGYRRSEEKPSYERYEGYGKQSYGGGEYRKNEEEGYGGGDVGYNWNEQSGYGRPSYGGDEVGSGRYKKSGYDDEEESSGYGRPSRYGGEDYGRSNYGIESYDEGEQKHHGHQKKHHHRHNYDED